MIAAGRRHDPSPRHLPRQQIRKSSPRLERTAMLQQFQLERDLPAVQSEVPAVHFDHRCPPYMRPYDSFYYGNAILIDQCACHDLLSRRARPGDSTTRMIWQSARSKRLERSPADSNHAIIIRELANCLYESGTHPSRTVE